MVNRDSLQEYVDGKFLFLFLTLWIFHIFPRRLKIPFERSLRLYRVGRKFLLIYFFFFFLNKTLKCKQKLILN